jgi:hypothetical protein
MVSKSADSLGAAHYEADYALVEEAEGMRAPNAMQKVGSGTGAISAPVRTGVLPVKLTLPTLGKSISVTNHLVTKENPVSLQVLIISTWFKYLFYLAAALAGLLAFRKYRQEHQ